MPKLRPTAEQLAIRRFNGFVRDGMKRNKLSQDRLGRAIGIDQGTVSRNLAEKNEWTLNEMFRICELFEEDYGILGGGR